MKKILIIDDNKNDLISYVAIFNDSKLGYKALSTEEGLKGYEMAINENPDVIIIDVHLADINGFEICTKLKQNKSTSHIPIIMISAWGSNQDYRLKSLNAGAETFLSKPIKIHEILAQVKVLIRIKQSEENLKKERDKYEKLAQNKTEKLRELNNYLNLQIRKLPIGLITLDADFKIKSWNPAATQIFGFSAKDTFGKKPDEIIISTKTKNITDKVKKELYKGSNSAHSINENITKDGRTIVCEWTNTPLIDEHSKIIGFLSMVKDITEQYFQRKLEKAITNLSKSLLSETGEGFLNKFVLQINDLLKSDITFIGLIDESQENIQSISACNKNQIIQNFEYPIANSPSAKVINKEICTFPSNLSDFFPNNKLIKKLKAEGYIGVPLINTQGKVLGLVAAIFNKPIPELSFDLSIIQIFTDRAVAEIERMRYEQAISKSESEFRRTVDEFPYPITITEANKNIYLNKKFSSTFGYTLEDIPTTSEWMEKAFPDKKYRSLAKTTLHQTLETAIDKNSEIKTQEWNLAAKDGSIRTCEYNMVLSGNTSLVVLNDISKRKRAELIQNILYQISNAANTTKELATFIHIIKESLGSVLDTTNFFVAFYDSEKDSLYAPYEADEKDNIESWPAKKCLTGLVITRKKPLFVTETEILRMIESGEIETVGSVAKSWLGVPLVVGEAVMGAFVVQNYSDENAYNKKDVKLLEFISHQISISIQRIKNEMKLEKALKKAIESDRLKSVFLSTMSHELRTPLNAIIGFSDLIDANTKPKDVERFVKTINNSGILLLELVEGLFDVTLIEAGEVQLEKGFHNLYEIIEDLLEITKVEKVKLNKKTIKIISGKYPFNKDFEVFTDKQKLKQVLLNLLKNALKFTHYGTINLDVTKEINEGKPFVKFVVKDTGIGIPSDKLNLIFDIFRQADDSHTRKYGGAGIGLSVTQKLTSLLDGTIHVESEVNKGTIFTVLIPLTDNKIKPSEDASEGELLKLKYPQKTILVVEDDAASMVLLRVHLEKLGVRIINAKNGKEAVNIFTKNDHQIDLVLMDINMPVMNGYEATVKIKALNPSIPIIAQTAYAISGDREKALSHSCNDYISKPIDGRKLISILKKYLS